MSEPACDGPTLFDVLIAIFEHGDPAALDGWPEAAQDLLRAGAFWPERN